MPSVIRKEVRKLKGYRLSSPPHRIKLNQNESPWDLPSPLKEEILERLRRAAWNRYPTPFCDPLRRKIAAREGWAPEGVIVSGGSNILIQALTIAASVGGKILTVTPSFSLYEIEGALLGNRVVAVPLRKGDFSFPRDLFLKRLKAVKPQAVFLANPNAPTGNLFPEEDLVAVMEKAPGLVVIDEAYYPFSGHTMAPYLKKHKNLVIVRTLSKAFSLGGVRLGYLL
ncbi:MAG TPA: aminotransferase class I/II-fold pyridoxal phosphate-dependent enzyme, partial [bacterium]|nr:aminotransferase class I/II-fold pyridoxal phosphate-dependent enzyme [bacterium]